MALYLYDRKEDKYHTLSDSTRAAKAKLLLQRDPDRFSLEKDDEEPQSASVEEKAAVSSPPPSPIKATSASSSPERPEEVTPPAPVSDPWGSSAPPAPAVSPFTDYAKRVIQGSVSPRAYESILKGGNIVETASPEAKATGLFARAVLTSLEGDTADTASVLWGKDNSRHTIKELADAGNLQFKNLYERLANYEKSEKRRGAGVKQGLLPEYTARRGIVPSALGLAEDIITLPGRAVRSATTLQSKAGEEANLEFFQEMAKRGIDRTMAEEIITQGISMAPVANLFAKATVVPFKLIPKIMMQVSSNPKIVALGKRLNGQNIETVQQIVDEAVRHSQSVVSGKGMSAKEKILERAKEIPGQIKKAALGEQGQISALQAGSVATNPDMNRDDAAFSALAMVAGNAIMGGAIGAMARPSAVEKTIRSQVFTTDDILNRLRTASNIEEMQKGTPVSQLVKEIEDAVAKKADEVGASIDPQMQKFSGEEWIDIFRKTIDKMKLSHAQVQSLFKTIGGLPQQDIPAFYTKVPFSESEAQVVIAPLMQKLGKITPKLPKSIQDRFQKAVMLAETGASDAEVMAAMREFRTSLSGVGTVSPRTNEALSLAKSEAIYLADKTIDEIHGAGIAPKSSPIGLALPEKSIVDALSSRTSDKNLIAIARSAAEKSGAKTADEFVDAVKAEYAARYGGSPKAKLSSENLDLLRKAGEYYFRLMPSQKGGFSRAQEALRKTATAAREEAARETPTSQISELQRAQQFTTGAKYESMSEGRVGKLAADKFTETNKEYQRLDEMLGTIRRVFRGGESGKLSEAERAIKGESVANKIANDAVRGGYSASEMVKLIREIEKESGVGDLLYKMVAKNVPTLQARFTETNTKGTDRVVRSLKGLVGSATTAMADATGASLSLSKTAAAPFAATGAMAALQQEAGATPSRIPVSLEREIMQAIPWNTIQDKTDYPLVGMDTLDAEEDIKNALSNYSLMFFTQAGLPKTSLRVTSGRRPDDGKSYHGKGNAIDFVPGPKGKPDIEFIKALDEMITSINDSARTRGFEFIIEAKPNFALQHSLSNFTPNPAQEGEYHIHIEPIGPLSTKKPAAVPITK